VAHQESCPAKRDWMDGGFSLQLATPPSASSRKRDLLLVGHPGTGNKSGFETRPYARCAPCPKATGTRPYATRDGAATIL